MYLIVRRLCVCILALGISQPVLAGDATIAGTATASAPSSSWVAVEAPLDGDDNRNGYSFYEIATSSAGPFGNAPVSWGYLPGTPEWRANFFGRGLILPNTSYFVRVTYVDPDGVIGANPQIVGPVTTLASSPNSVTVGTATAEARSDEIFVRVPLADDADIDSLGTVDVATGPSGPWTRKCGSTFDRNLANHPLRCRIRSLTPETDYWVRVTVLDPDGVSGPNPQILGPVRYTGLRNLALGKPITADPGWGCCPSPSHLVDGRIQNDAWYFGFAWTGGNSRWAGGAPGFKQATIDLGQPTLFDRAAVWYHDSASVPVVWKFQVSDDGSAWTDVVSVAEPICRGATTEVGVGWGHPACAHDATFEPVTARFFRFTFDDRTLFRGLHGWAVEIEVFDTSTLPPDNQAPVADAGGDLLLAAGDDCLATAELDATASFDPDGDALAFTWSGAFGTRSGETLSVDLPPGDHTVTLTVEDGQGGSAADEVLVTVEDVSAPVFGGLPAAVDAECAGPAGTPVALAAPTAVDNCDGAVAVVRDAPGLFPLGTTAVTFTAGDAAGNTASASVEVTVADTTAPAISSLAASPGVLWPPNHKLRPVTLDVAAADACDSEPPACRLVAVTSDEPVDGTGDGDTAPDWEVTGDLTAKLRAERSGDGDGRVYTLEVRCTDAAGNDAAGNAGVSVPHNR